MRTHLCPLPVLQKGAYWRRTCSVLFDDPTDEEFDTRNLSCARLSCNCVGGGGCLGVGMCVWGGGSECLFFFQRRLTDMTVCVWPDQKSRYPVHVPCL